MQASIEELCSVRNYLEEQAERLGNVIKEKDIEINFLKNEIERLQNLDKVNSVNGMQQQQMTQSIIDNMNQKFEVDKKIWVEETTKLKDKISDLEKKLFTK